MNKQFFLCLALLLSLSCCSADSAQSSDSIDTTARSLESTVILISIDGMGVDYLDRFHAPHLAAFAEAGLQAEALRPVFPTKTFPNHYSLVTGLYPENHGIVDNAIYDPEYDAVFGMRLRDEVENPRWWGGEPIWVTAEKQGQVSATFFFPGSEAPIQGISPSYWYTYDDNIPNRERVDTVIEWLEKPQADRPRIITLYFSDVDTIGHQYGPYGAPTGEALTQVDIEIGYLLEQLDRRGFREQVDVIITSDHGMAEVDLSKHIIIDEAFDTDLADRVLYSRELVSIFPQAGQKDEIYRQLQQNLPPQATVYRKSEMPERFHFSQNRRIAPLIAMVDIGHIFLRRSWLEGMLEEPESDRPRGGHGYDNAAPEMLGVLMAQGPSFHAQTRVGELSMVDIYNVMAAILELQPAPNDGNPDVLPLLLRNHGNHSTSQRD